jgi:divalent metal cation (Fe/Co/Zn/Cd) transporter
MSTLETDTRELLVRRGQFLEYLTIAYNVLEGVIAIAAGLVASSIALIGFGLDSGIEVAASALLVWRLLSDVDPKQREKSERRALTGIGVLFLLLAAYVTFESASALWTRESPQASPVGIALAAASMAVMPLLARAKRRVASKISSRALRAEAVQTQLCAYLSAILLGGLALNALFGWWWADSLAALAMVPIMISEGREALRGEECSCH